MRIITVFIFQLFALISGKQFLCSLNETITLDKNEIIFFQSFEFPQMIISDVPCLLNISIFNSSSTQKLIVAYNAIDTHLAVSKHTFHFLVIDEMLNTKELGKNQTEAVQGFAVSEDITEGCPLETISKDGPFELSDETEIIHLRSTFFQNQSRKFPCLWKFNSTIQYGFKIVFTNLTISSNTTLIVKNSTDAYIGTDMITLNHAYYNDDNYIEISLSLGDPDFKTDLEFQAYISVVKKHYEIVDANCILRYDGPKNGTLWWYTNQYYPSNSRCSFDIVIQPNTAIKINYAWSSMEQNVDFIRYNIDGQGWIIFDGISFNIEGYKNESTKNVWFEFVSDGSLQFGGFKLDIVEFPCECANSRFPCAESHTGLMTSGYFYCSHMRCNFTFEPCFGVYLDIVFYTYDGDSFIFKSNNQTVFEISEENKYQNEYYLHFNPASFNTLEAVTSSGKIGRFTMSNVFSAFPPVQTYTLSNENISYDFYRNSVAILSFKISDELKSQNLSIILYSNRDDLIQVYNNDSLTYMLESETCLQGSNSNKCTVYANQFATLIQSFLDNPAIHDLNDINPIFLAVRLSQRRKGCVLEENIFVASSDTHSIVGIADSEGECMIRLLITLEAEFFTLTKYLITYLWTTAKNNTVKIYVGSDTSHLLFQFNKETMTQWGNVGLFSAIYTIIIPKKSSLLMTLKKYDAKNSISQSPFHKSVIATSYFGTLQIHDSDVFDGDNKDKCLNNLISYDTSLSPIKLTVLYNKMMPEDDFYFVIDQIKCINLDVGHSIYLKEQGDVKFCYNRVGTTDDGSSGIIFFVEPIDKDELASSEMELVDCKKNFGNYL